MTAHIVNFDALVFYADVLSFSSYKYHALLAGKICLVLVKYHTTKIGRKRNAF